METWSWLGVRAMDLWARQVVDGDLMDPTGSGNAFGNGVEPSRLVSRAASASAAGNESIYAAALADRTATLALSCINVAAAFATIVYILWDSYSSAKRRERQAAPKFITFSFLRPNETFPLVLSVGIFVQGLFFAGAQSIGLKSLLILGCSATSQLMFAAAFIVPYLQFVFGLEVTARAFQQQAFSPRRKWTVLACVALVNVFVLIHYVVSVVVRPQNFCFPSLFWFLQRYAMASFALFVTIASTLFLTTVIVTAKLRSAEGVDPAERFAASSMTYHMVAAVVINILLVPFFQSLAFDNIRETGRKTEQLSLLSGVVGNMTGLVTGGLHLFLRFRSGSTTRPENPSRSSSDRIQALKRGIRLWPTPSETNLAETRAPRQAVGFGDLQFGASTDTLIMKEKEEEAMIESPGFSPVTGNANANLPRLDSQLDFKLASRVPQPPPPVSPNPSRSIISAYRKSSYSLFPAGENTSNTTSTTLLPSTTYSPTSQLREYAIEDDDHLQPPPTVQGPGNFRHRRESSVSSSATVQIGLRFSNVDDIPPLNSRYFRDSGKVHSINYTEQPPASMLNPTKKPSPLASSNTVDSQYSSDYAGDNVYDNRSSTTSTVNSSILDARSSGTVSVDLSQFTLSSKVYSPAAGNSPVTNKNKWA